MNNSESNETLQAEKARLAEIVSLIEKRFISIKSSQGGVREDVTEIRQTFWEDVTVNIENTADAVETLASIRQQAELLSERERTHGHMSKQLKTLSLLKDSPYFGRVDFHEDGESSTDIIYLGISSLMDDAKENFLIYDWRAPISSIYYDYSPGYAQYETPGGIVKGEMERKRQYIIKNGQLKSMFDTGITIGDEILKEVLGQNADNQMKNIVATIQKEQNALIRNDQNQYLVVQGAAGSGKTSAALQRVAYLLYRHVHEIKADNILLFSPNPLFSSYTATVLPSLGEDNMQQVTFFDYIAKLIGEDYVVSDPFEQMEYVLRGKEDEFYEARVEAIRFKNTLSFKNLIDQYIKSLSTDGLQFKNIILRGKTLLASSDIVHYFYSLDPSLSIQSRLQSTKEWLLKELYKIEKLERQAEWVEEEIELLDTKDYTNNFRRMRKKKSYTEDTFNDFEQEKNELAKKVTHKYFKPIRIAIKQYRFLHVKKMYNDLFQPDITNKLGLDSVYLPNRWEEIGKLTKRDISQNRLSYEDASPYLYFKEELEGIRSNRLIRHLFIDEAQDYSAFHLKVIQQLFPNCRMTILGDMNQAIYAHSYGAPTLLSENLYPADKMEKIALTKSYRSTRQIIEFTSGILSHIQIDPFNRNGILPILYQQSDIFTSFRLINQLLEGLQEAGHQTIAIICKTQNEADAAYEKLKDKADVQLMDKSIYRFTKGILILPAYLAKGIEFDAVILFDASKEKYNREHERNLLYTACTRAMHELHILSCGEPSPFFKEIPSDLYEVKYS
ncbi:RNA polymerase recycling motor HelD [Pradoshia sp.]